MFLFGRLIVGCLCNAPSWQHTKLLEEVHVPGLHASCLDAASPDWLLHQVISAAAANWVQPEKRERKQRVDYNQNRIWNSQMGIQPGRCDLKSPFLAVPCVPPMGHVELAELPKGDHHCCAGLHAPQCILQLQVFLFVPLWSNCCRAHYLAVVQQVGCLCRQGSGKCCRPTGPKLPKMPALQDFQFYQTERLKEIYEKEAAFELHQHSQAQKEAQARAQVSLYHKLRHLFSTPQQPGQELSSDQGCGAERLAHGGAVRVCLCGIAP